MKALPAGNTGMQMTGWFRKPIEKVEDFNGLRRNLFSSPEENRALLEEAALASGLILFYGKPQTFVGKNGDEKEWAVIDQVNARMVKKALAMGGTATGEHGVGIGKRKFMQAEHGHSLEWMKKIKNLFDPKGILNPGKIFH